MQVLRSIKYNLEHGGLPLVLRKSGSRLRALIYRSETWLLLERGLEATTPPSTSSELRIQAMNIADLLAHAYFKAVHFPEVLEARFREGDLCIGVLINGTLAHVNWMAHHRLPLDRGLPSYPAEGSAGVYDGFTLPDFRRRGCQTIAVQELLHRARATGLTRAITAVHSGNRASLSVLGRCGFQVVGQLTYRRILWRGRLQRASLES